jgi:hypothetical protein
MVAVMAQTVTSMRRTFGDIDAIGAGLIFRP